MATMKILFSLVFLLICWKLVSSQESQDVNDMSDNSEKVFSLQLTLNYICFSETFTKSIENLLSSETEMKLF